LQKSTALLSGKLPHSIYRIVFLEDS
jgi:hypothetical protein